MSNFKPSDKVRHKNGFERVVLATHGDEFWGESVSHSGHSGIYSMSDFELIPPPPIKHVRYVNVYRDGACCYVHTSAEAARTGRDNGVDPWRKDVLATVRVEFEEGQDDTQAQS